MFFFKLPYLAMKLGQVEKCSEVAHIPALFLLQWGDIEPISAASAAVFEIQSDFQICYIWAGNLNIGKNSRSSI